MEKYENIIVGAGISGLCCGGYLANAGQKTLILESHNHPGGRLTTHKSKTGDYAFNLHGLTHHPTMGEYGWVTAAKELGVNHQEQFVPAAGKSWRRGEGYKYLYKPCKNMDEWLAFAEKVSLEPLTESGKKDFQRILEEVLNWDFAKLCTELDTVFLRDYLNERTNNPQVQHIFFLLMAETIMMDVEDVKRDISAGKGWTLLRQWINKEGPFCIASKGLDHQSALVEPFAQRFVELGGELKLNSKVTEVIIEGGRAKGVMVGDQEYLAARVIVSCPFPYISQIIKDLPAEIAEPVEDLKKAWYVDVDGFWGLSKTLTDDPRYTFAMDPRDWSFLLGAQYYSLFFPWNAPKDIHSYWAEKLYRKEDFEKRGFEKCCNEVDGIMEEIYPGFNEAVVDKFYDYHPLVWHHQYSAYKKIPQEPKSIQGLYFIGDSTAPQYGTASDASASTGVRVAKRILGLIKD